MQKHSKALGHRNSPNDVNIEQIYHTSHLVENKFPVGVLSDHGEQNWPEKRKPL